MTDKPNESTKQDNDFISDVCDHFENSEFEPGLNRIKYLRTRLGIGNKLITDLYDSCVRILIRNCVKTAFDCSWLKDNSYCLQTDLNQWVVAQSPARIDLQVITCQ